jgi:hypothetical protein
LSIRKEDVKGSLEKIRNICDAYETSEENGLRMLQIEQMSSGDDFRTQVG